MGHYAVIVDVVLLQPQQFRPQMEQVDLREDEVELCLKPSKTIPVRVPDNQLRILIFTATYFVLDGVTLTIRRLESYLRSRGAIVKICSTVPDDLTPEQIKDIIVVPGIKIPFTDAGTGYAFGVGLDENTIREIELYNPNCVHFTVPDFVGLDGIRWCQRRNVAYIGTWHSNYCDYLKYYYIEWILGPGFHRYLKGFYEQIPAVYVPTTYMLKRMEEWGYGVATELIQWGRGIDLQLFSPDRRSAQFRTAKGFSEEDVVVLWVGRIVPEKRPDIWLDVVKRLQAEGLPVKPMVVGNGTFEKSLAQLKNVACCGWMSGVALAEAYASADILLFPSDVETFGNVTLEASASGCVCVVEAKCGGHLVETGVNGLCCPAGDFEAFYQATRQLVVDTARRRVMSQRSRESSFRFERHKIMQQMLENYKDAIERHSDPMYIKNRLKSSPEAAGKNILTFLCCDYWLVKQVAEPFLNTSHGVQNIVTGTHECIQASRSRLNCNEIAAMEEANEASRYEDERKGRNLAFSGAQAACLVHTVQYTAIAVSYLLVLLVIYAAFTI